MIMGKSSTEMRMIPRTLANELLQQAQAGGDNEICGLVGARTEVQGPHLICTCYPIPNIAEQPRRRYVMDPASHIQAMREMRSRDETLFAIYHSHPSSPAAPSTTDLAEANYPEALYLIISLNTKGVLELCGFRLINGQSREVELVLE